MKVKEESEKVGLKHNIQKTKIMASSPITSWQIDGETMETVTDYFLSLQNHCRWWHQHEIKRHLIPRRKVMTNLDSILKSRDITLLTFADNILFHHSYVFFFFFPAVMYECESWTVKKAECWKIDAVVLWFKKTLESPLDCKEIKPINPKGNQSWIFIERTDAEAPILWPPEDKNWLTGKDPDAGKDWRKEEKGLTEDEMIGWHHWLNGHEFEQTAGVGGGQGSLVCYSPCGCRVEHDWVTELNWLRPLEYLGMHRDQSWIFTEGLLVKLQSFCCLMWRADSLEIKKKQKPEAGKDWRQKEKRAKRMIWLPSITNST